jgi:hypothetical protein
MFYAAEDATRGVDLDRIADSAVRVLMSAYGR